MTSLSDLMYVHDSVNSCIPQLRKVISLASGVELNNIRNGLSIRGTDLIRQNGKSLVAFQPDDSFIVFYLRPTDDLNVTASEPDGSISNFISVELNMNLYGNDCIDRLQRLKASIKSAEMKDLLDEFGFTITRMDNGTVFTEPINGIFYLRCDFTISFNTVISYERCDCQNNK